MAIGYQLLTELEIKFSGTSQMMAVIGNYRTQLNGFKAYMPIILKLRNEAFEKYN